MKKLLFSLLSLLMVSGLAWADGVKVSGTVTFQERTDIYTGNGEYIMLKNSDGSVVQYGEFKTNYDHEQGTTTYTYEFNDVAAGSYTLLVAVGLYNPEAMYSQTASVTVASEDVNQPIELQEDKEHAIMNVIPKYNNESYPGYFEQKPLGGVTITCLNQGTNETVTRTSSANSYDGVTFYCDTLNTYAITLHKEGYKDTTHKTKAWVANSGNSGKERARVTILMQEDFGNQVTLKGSVAVKDMADAQLNGLGLKLSWGDKTYQAKIENGAYEFSDRIPVGEVVYAIQTVTFDYGYENWNDTKNWAFESSNANTLTYTLEGADNATVTNNLTVVRVGVDVSGRMVDGSSSYPSVLSNVKVKISNAAYVDSMTTSYDGAFSFSGIKDGTYTVTFAKDGYTAEPKTVTINLAGMKLDSTIQFGDIAMTPAESDFYIYGTAYYNDDSYQRVNLNQAKVVCYSDASRTMKLDSAYTNAEGAWSMTIRCFSSTELYLDVFHEDIEPGSGKTSRQAQYFTGSSVDLSCQKKMPPVYGMVNYRVKQDFSAAKPTVNLTWEWPEELTENYGTTYEIYSIQVQRSQNNGDYNTVDWLYGANYNNFTKENLPVSYVDTMALSNDTLKIGSTYTYQFNISYQTPSKSLVVKDSAKLTVTLLAEEPVKDSFNLRLQVNDATMGSVEGEGKYEEGTEVTIKAIANEGYVFQAWKAGENEISKEAEHKVTMMSDSTLTAVFAAELVEPVKDSFELTLRCDAAMGTVEGAGKYEEGTPVDIKATANEGYVFVAWMSGNDTVAKTAEHKITLMSDSILTAVFAKKSVEPSANEDVEQAAWSVYAQGGQIVLRSDAACQYDVYNMAGALVKCAKTHANEYRIAVNNSGLYIVRRISSTGISVKKVMVR